MADPWIDDDNSEVVLHVQTKEQLKRIEERRLIEESDLVLTKLLFQDDKIFKKEIKNSLVNPSKKDSKKTIEQKDKYKL